MALQLPTPEEIDRLSADEIRALYVEVEREKANLKRRGAFSLFTPYKYQREWFECTKKIMLILAGNQVGKTETGAILTLSGCLGTRPPSLGGKIPTNWADLDCHGKKFLVCGENFTSAIPKTILPKLKKYIVPEMLSRPPKKGGSKMEELFWFKSGAELHIMSYDQDPDSFEGSVWDGVWLDEPPPQPIFTAIHRGCMRSDTRIIITATPIKEPWMFESFVAPLRDENSEEQETTALFQCDMHANCVTCFGEGAYEHHEIMEFLRKITNPYERAARETGSFLSMQGLEFQYVSRETHITPDFY